MNSLVKRKAEGCFSWLTTRVVIVELESMLQDFFRSHRLGDVPASENGNDVYIDWVHHEDIVPDV